MLSAEPKGAGLLATVRRSYVLLTPFTGSDPPRCWPPIALVNARTPRRPDSRRRCRRVAARTRLRHPGKVPGSYVSEDLRYRADAVVWRVRIAGGWAYVHLCRQPGQVVRFRLGAGQAPNEMQHYCGLIPVTANDQISSPAAPACRLPAWICLRVRCCRIASSAAPLMPSITTPLSASSGPISFRDLLITMSP